MGKKWTRYSAEQREEALSSVREFGLRETERRLGIPKSTLSRWVSASRAGDSDDSEPDDTAGEAPAVDESVAESQSDAPSRVARSYTPSQRAEAVELAAQVGVTEAAKKLGMSRFSIYEWRRKARLHAEGKADSSPLVGSDEDGVSARDRRILRMWKKHPGLGPTQVRNQLRRDGFKVAVHTVRRVMEEHGYIPPKARRREAHDQRYEAVRPNHLWHADFVHRFINKLHIYVLILLDDFSRFITGAAIWDGERVDAAITTFEAAVSRHGRPEMLMSDGGSAFWAWRGTSRFTRLLEEMDIDQLVARKPQVNGKIEALNANVHKEVFDQERFFDLGETQRRLRAWVEFYNLRRTHTALGGLLVPGDRYFGRADEVLARIEAGAAPDGLGEPLPVGRRTLDMLRVTSYGGELAVHLMGQQIWPAPPRN